jgi:hypothetical protein
MFIPAEQIRKQFARALREALIARYGKLPAASHVSREFNLRAYGVDSISQESARRWLRGLSVPTQDKLAILSNWLALDLNSILCVEKQGGASPPAAAALPIGTHSAYPTNGRNAHGPGNESDEPPLAILQMLSSLTELERNLMMELLSLLASRTPLQPQAPDLNGGGGVRAPEAPGILARPLNRPDPAPGRAAGRPHPLSPPPGE